MLDLWRNTLDQSHLVDRRCLGAASLTNRIECVRWRNQADYEARRADFRLVRIGSNGGAERIIDTLGVSWPWRPTGGVTALTRSVVAWVRDQVWAVSVVAVIGAALVAWLTQSTSTVRVEVMAAVALLVMMLAVVARTLKNRDLERQRLAALTDCERDLRGRVVASLSLLGVQDTTVQRIVGALFSRELPPWGSPPSPGTVALLKGPLGAGKTTLAEAFLLSVVNAAQRHSNAPVPVFLDASLIERSLREEVTAQAAGMGDPSQQGAVVILDGLEQAGPRRSRDLLVEAIALVQVWPRTSVIATGRSELPNLSGVKVHEIEALSRDEWVSLAREVAGRAQFTSPDNYPKSVQDAATRPLFAILIGLWMSNAALGQPNTVAALVRHLIDSSLDRAHVDHTGTLPCLVTLARLSTDSGGRPVRLDRVPGCRALRQALLDTGIVRVDGGRASFTLAIFSEWLAGQALLDEPDMLDSADMDRLELWRYAVVQAVASATHEQAQHIMGGLVRKAPLLAGWTIYSAIHDDVVPPAHADPGAAQEWAEFIVRAMECWRDAMGQLAAATTPTALDGQAAALGVRVEGPTIVYGWSRKAGRIVELPHGVGPFSPAAGWGELAQHVALDDSLFEWLCTWRRVSTRLQQLLKDAWLPPCTPALQSEYDWHLAQLASGHGSSGFRCDPVPLEELEQLLDVVMSSANLIVNGHFVSVSQLRDLVERHRAHDLNAVTNPWECADQPAGWISLSWSAEARLKRLQKAFEAALEGYNALVSGYLASFRSQLETAGLMPVKLRGFAYENTRAQEPMARWNEMWYLEPLERGQSNSVEWTQVETPPRWDALAQDLRASFVANRPELPVQGVISSGIAGFYSARPAANLVVTLLWRDFARWGWVSGVGPDLFYGNSPQREVIPDDIYWKQTSA